MNSRRGASCSRSTTAPAMALRLRRPTCKNSGTSGSSVSRLGSVHMAEPHEPQALDDGVGCGRQADTRRRSAGPAAPPRARRYRRPARPRLPQSSPLRSDPVEQYGRVRAAGPNRAWPRWPDAKAGDATGRDEADRRQGRQDLAGRRGEHRCQALDFAAPAARQYGDDRTVTETGCPRVPPHDRDAPAGDRPSDGRQSRPRCHGDHRDPSRTAAGTGPASAARAILCTRPARHAQMDGLT